ncbi:MAG: M48 family metallopeptidase [Planctomycetota bacterium]
MTDSGTFLARTVRSRWLTKGLGLAIGTYRALDAVLAGIAGMITAKGWSAGQNGWGNAILGDDEPDASIGPMLTRDDAPDLFNILEDLARQLGGGLPTEVRLSYLPACGVLDLGSQSGYPRQVLIIGLPCFLILRTDELRAVLAHELAHLTLEDAVFTRDIVNFSQELHRKMRRGADWSDWVNPRYWLARSISFGLAAATASVSRAMEYRADDWSAACFGTRPLASALEKLAIVQPIFREVLFIYDPIARPAVSVYAYFLRVWKRLPAVEYKRLRKRFVKGIKPDRFDPHPPVYKRIKRLTGPEWTTGRWAMPAAKLLAAPEELVTLMNNRLYAEQIEPTSVFRKNQ